MQLYLFCPKVKHRPERRERIIAKNIAFEKIVINPVILFSYFTIAPSASQYHFPNSIYLTANRGFFLPFSLRTL
ncbi:MAG: hypothetical protein ACLRWH_06560, partial [Emergencia sp.]